MSQPIVKIGEFVHVRWLPSESSSDIDEQIFKVKVTAIRLCKTVKHSSAFKYSIEFSDGSIRTTRLLHVLERMDPSPSSGSVAVTSSSAKKRKRGDSLLPPHRYILAPMVGGSELAFRLLCRRYGADLAYTPMMSAEKFARDADYRQEEFQTTAADRPLVAHFAANNAQILLAAARHIEHQADAIDINLGCPQRIAHAGHFGSYLLGNEDRDTVLDMVRTLSAALTIPVFVKIRLLDTVEETVLLCRQLVEAGARLIAVHARYRVNLVGRTGPGAREGLAHLDQVKTIKEQINRHVPIIANGNVQCFDDISANLQSTRADGIMTAEGILDNPAIFTPSSQQPQKLQLAMEYLELATQYPVKIKSIIFHIRRICKVELEKYQFLEELLASQTLSEVQSIVQRAVSYESNGGFVFDPLKHKRTQEAIARRKAELGKRKDFEDRMKRKAKREGKDPFHYLNEGALNPTEDELLELKAMSIEKAFEVWKANHAQHCFKFHFDAKGCARDRTCAFLHSDPSHSVVQYG